MESASPPIAASAIDPMILARVLPFRAIRYNVSHPEVDIGHLVAPPGEEMITNPQAMPTHQPVHALHLFPPQERASRSGSLDVAEWQRLRTTFTDYCQRRVLCRDAIPSVYLHSLTFEAEDGSHLTRRGFFALVALTSSGTVQILPHEHTLSTRRDRQIVMLEAVGAQMLPIFLVYSDPTDSVMARLERCSTDSDLLADFTDGLNQHHRLSKAGGTEIGQWLEAQFRDREVLIADGHHRFDALQSFWKDGLREGAALLDLPDLPDVTSYFVAYLTSADAPGFRVGAIHRIFKHLPDGYETFLNRAEGSYRRTRYPLDPLHPGRKMLEILAASGTGSFAFYGRGQTGWDLIRPASQSLPATIASLPDALRCLDVSRLHHDLIPHLGGTASAIGIEYERDASKAFHEVQGGAFDACCFLNPIRPDQIWAVAREGLAMPPKATYFFPKVPAGLVGIPLLSATSNLLMEVG